VLATGTVDVIGVDPGRAEGITGFKKVTERCEFYRRQANAHAWSSAIVTAASLAISFNSPSCKLFEFKPLRNPMQHDLVTRPFDHVDGWVYPPTGPGLGIEVIEEVVEGYRSEKVLGRL
jgi:L-alanine-DL-glutamate epimerase-like enolase superfamily enzyme